MTLGGFLFVRNGIEYDYNYEESILSLLQFCDKVSVVDAGSDDGTKERLIELELSYPKLFVTYLTKQEWLSQHGKEKLNYFQNIALKKLDTDYQFLCQADEIVHESSYNKIREAMATGGDGFLCHRINLWGSAFTELNVPADRMPCSPYVIRLTKTGYLTYGDGESINCLSTFDFANHIEIWHYGFVRKIDVMKSKVINMQKSVFEMNDYDPKLDLSETFNWRLWFSEDDLTLIKKEHPVIMHDWIKKRL